MVCFEINHGLAVSRAHVGCIPNVLTVKLFNQGICAGLPLVTGKLKQLSGMCLVLWHAVSVIILCVCVRVSEQDQANKKEIKREGVNEGVRVRA